MLVAVVPTAASAQQWSSLGTPGGWIKRIAVAPTDPATVYAGVHASGLYRSADSGRSWTRVAVAEIGRDTVYALAFDPANKAIVYAGTETKGVFKTGDGGAHRTAINTGLPAPFGRPMTVLTLAVDPVNPAVMLAGGAKNSFDGTTNLIISTSGG